MAHDETDALAKENSAVRVAVFAASNAGQLHRDHVSELLSIAAWMFTEARGKYTTKYVTSGALDRATDLRHEHVVTRKSLREAILLHPERAEELLRLAVACTVTKEEHALLQSTRGGWYRYIDASLKVFDRYTPRPHKEVDLRAMADELQSRWDELTGQKS